MSKSLTISKKTKTDASQILKEKDIVKLLSKYGDVRIGGSFYTDLMYGPDIDITVATSNPHKSAVSFLNDVIKRKLFQKYQYGDFENFPRENRPTDHIVVLILPFNNRKWEIEIWFSKKHNPQQILLEEKLCKLSEKFRQKIIGLKDKREKSGLSKHKLSSFDIYKKFI